MSATLVKNALVVTLDDGTILPNGQILIEGQKTPPWATLKPPTPKYRAAAWSSCPA